MLPVSLYDEVEIRKIKGETPRGEVPAISVICDDPMVPNGEKNLAYRAATLLLKKANRRDRIEIRIDKNIPVGAGLGGGRTDAAAVLVGLNRLLKLGYSARQLEKIGVAIGADVPFFYSSAAGARARNRRAIESARRSTTSVDGDSLPGIRRFNRMGLSEFGPKVDKT